jgi:hypothetical protein
MAQASHTSNATGNTAAKSEVQERNKKIKTIPKTKRETVL